MPAVKIGVATSSLHRPLRSALQSVSQAAADGVEVDLRSELPAAELSDSAVRQLRKLLADLRLSIASATFPTRRGLGDRQQLDRRVAATRTAMTAAKKLGAALFVLRMGDLPPSGDERRELLTDTLTGLARHADHVGLRLALLPNPAGVDHLAELLVDLPAQLVGACLDPAGLITDGGSLQHAIATLGPRLAHVYAADAVRDLSGDGATAVELGRGSVEWPELLGGLEEHDYRDWIVVRQRDSADAEELANAVAYLRAV